MKIYEAMADAFVRENVKNCFALLGDANMHWAGAMAARGVKSIYTRHEHAAVAAATAYARTSGKVGCATVTCGPGLTQIMTVLPIAVRAKIPLVIFAGEAPLHKAWYNQAIDQEPFVTACGAHYRALHDPSAMISEIHEAFAHAKQHQVPVLLGVPFDLQQMAWDPHELPPGSDEIFQPHPPIPPDHNLILEAARWIQSAERPIVLAGLGAVTSDCYAACVSLAEKSGALLATTLPTKGFFHDQPFCLGVAGGYATQSAKELFAQSDLVIGIGTRLASHTFDGGSLTPNASVIQINMDPQEVVQGRKAADLLVKSDARLGAEALIRQLSQQEGWRNSDMAQHAKNALELPDDRETPDGFIHPMAAIKMLAEVIPDSCHVVNTSGHSAYYTAQMNNHPHDHYTVIREFGAIGNGTSFVLGVAAAHPDRPVVLIDGDGSALMHIQELDTMKRHDLKVLIIVLNDGAYGSEIHKLRADGVGVEGAVFGRPDFSKIGIGFGLSGKTFTELKNLGAEFEEFLTNDGPAIWDIHISDQIASPQILKAHKAAHS